MVPRNGYKINIACLTEDYVGTKVTGVCFYLSRAHEILCCGHESLSRGHKIAKSWPRDSMSWPRGTNQSDYTICINFPY
jgi:hypothetical protein